MTENAAIAPELLDLIAISRRYGADPAFVLAGGGNTSFKSGNRLWVKASGHALATIGADGFVELDRDALQGMLVDRWPDDAKVREAQFVARVMASRLHPERNQRPSVEALLHHLLPDPLVVHTHPGVVNALTCCVDGERLARELLGDRVLWQPYVDPGVFLAQTLSRAFEDHRQRTGQNPEAILLANHGLIVSGKSALEIAEISDRMVRRLHDRLASQPPSPWARATYPRKREAIAVFARAIAESLPQHHVVTDESAAVIELASCEAGRDAALAGPLTPDQIVYCRSIPLWIEKPASDSMRAAEQFQLARRAYLDQHGLDPWVCLIAGSGMIALRESAKLAEITRSLYADAASVYCGAARLGGVRVLNQRDRQFIEQWEVEAFRRQVMSQSAAK
jgi:rhamnose utilization protein RhaD (predicted bifunctional aldolase and dehydrogenase)